MVTPEGINRSHFWTGSLVEVVLTRIGSLQSSMTESLKQAQATGSEKVFPVRGLIMILVSCLIGWLVAFSLKSKVFRFLASYFLTWLASPFFYNIHN